MRLEVGMTRSRRSSCWRTGNCFAGGGASVEDERCPEEEGINVPEDEKIESWFGRRRGYG
jgi:hypothetical protein